MRALNGGSGKVPTILIKNGSECAVLIEPGDRELADALRQCGEAFRPFSRWSEIARELV